MLTMVFAVLQYGPRMSSTYIDRTCIQDSSFPASKNIGRNDLVGAYYYVLLVVSTDGRCLLSHGIARSGLALFFAREASVGVWVFNG